MKRRTFLSLSKQVAALGLVCIGMLPVLANADGYPSKPITIIMPWPAGGPADQRARQIAERLTKAMGQPVIVENRPGASGTIGASTAAKARPDGYTLLYGTPYELAIYPASGGTGFDALRDFIPITKVVSAFMVLNARPGLAVNSLEQLISLAKARPGQLNCGSAGNTTAPHFALEVLKRSANIDVTHVPFKGEAPLLTDLMGGHVDCGFNITTSSLPYIKAGKLVPLAVSSPRRLTALPDVPTMSELKLPELEITLWGGVLAPAHTAADIVTRLNVELVTLVSG